jgi:TolB-like protein/tetratricopeptide (TPR) repeat protein
MALAAALMLVVLGVLAWWAVGSKPASRPAAAGEPGPTAGAPRSIAVLPFVNLTGDPDLEYVADGIPEEVLHLLVEGEGLRVIARTSSFAFKGRSMSIADIAAALHVDYVVEGSVRRSGTNLRVSTQLIDTSSSSQVWSKVYEGDPRRLLDVQQDIAERIATTLQASLGAGSRAARHVPAPAAHDAYLRARFFFHRRFDGDLQKAEDAYREALRLDPQFARAWAGLAGVYGVRFNEQGADLSTLLPKQREAIDAALALDPELAEARVRAASYYYQVGDEARALQEEAIARRLAPDDPLVLSWQASDLAVHGRFDEAIGIQRRLLSSDPASRITRGNLAVTLLAAGRLEEARAEYLNYDAMGAEPDPDAAMDLARIDILSGRYQEALTAAETWPDGPDRNFVLAAAGAGMGRNELARDAEARLRAGKRVAEAVRLAELLAYRNQREDALHWAEIAFDRLGPSPDLSPQWQWLYTLRLSPFLQPLRDDPRWAEARERAVSSADAKAVEPQGN